MRTILIWILLAHAIHLPVPFPDLDGECRGAPIQSISESSAWHVMMVGVRPNDDIDRGPIRTHDDGRNAPAGESILGEAAYVASPANSLALRASLDSSFPLTLILRGFELTTKVELRAVRAQRGIRPEPTARTACISFCTWQV